MFRRWAVVLSGLGVMLCGAGSASAVVMYRVTDLGPGSDAYGINTSGQVGLYGFLCQPSRVRYLLVSSGRRPSNIMAKWFSASFQCRTGIVHRSEASRIAM